MPSDINQLLADATRTKAAFDAATVGERLEDIAVDLVSSVRAYQTAAAIAYVTDADQEVKTAKLDAVIAAIRTRVGTMTDAEKTFISNALSRVLA